MLTPQEQTPEAPATLPSRPWRTGRERRGRRTTTIHVPLDGSATALRAIPLAVEVGRLTGAAMHIIHVGKIPVRPEDLPSLLKLDPSALRGAAMDCRTGDPAETIVQIAVEHNTLALVMTTHGEARAPEPLGPVAAVVANQAPCPILLIRPEVRIRVPFRRILLPLDGTPSAAAAIVPAIDLAYRAGASLEVLYVAWEKDSPSQEPGAMTAPRYVDQPHHEWPAWAQEFLDRFSRTVGQTGREVPTQLSLLHGQPGSEILQFARDRDIDIIVLARPPQLDFSQPSLTGAVLNTAPCPVMLLHKEPGAYAFPDQEHEALFET